MDDLIIYKSPRYEKKGECNRCGWCCLQEDSSCPYLKREDSGIYTCTVYDDEKKKYVRCGMFPGNPPIIHEECGYYFIDTWEDNKIVKRKV